jgi:hypothetical protein
MKGIFRDPMEEMLSKSVCSQELSVSMTETFLTVATRRVKEHKKKCLVSLKEFLGQRRTPRISQ